VSIVFYVVAGFFFYGVGMSAWLDPHAAGAGKFVIMGIFLLFALLALVAGLALTRFQKWKRDTGIVLISGAAVDVMVVLSFASMMASPALMNSVQDSNMRLFNDYFTGVGYLVLLGLAGIALILSSRQQQRSLLPNR